MERKRTTQRLTPHGSFEVNSASHSPWVVRSKLSVSLPMGRSTGCEPVHYEICELRRRPIGSRCIEFIIRPNFLTSNSR
ncbi:hypothetical protein MAL08_01770 [Leptospira noguchii]|uniref:hypothetical protein n=1 Tax=Leptospira noguchii TaxID=28182 RepID=UPI001FB77AA9|nr:hypothetical protein [Leptospira noguchii]UOG38120.1 hypothetical protein MAL08_01770 [Leptospira noguchii]